MPFSKPKVPKPNKELEAAQLALINQNLENAKNPPALPKFDTPKPQKFAPPPSMAGSDAIDAEQRARKQAQQRGGLQSTVLAPRTPAGTRTLLG